MPGRLHLRRSKPYPPRRSSTKFYRSINAYVSVFSQIRATLLISGSNSELLSDRYRRRLQERRARLNRHPPGALMSSGGQLAEKN